MRVGVPAEMKTAEARVGLIPGSVSELIGSGHTVLVESGAGIGAGFSDDEYVAAGAKLADNADEVFASSEMIVKVKEPQAIERARLTADHTLFTYLHLAPDAAQTADLVASGATCIAYETVTDRHGRLPLLAPMSQVAGRMSIQAGAHSLEATQGGRGLLLGGVPGVAPGRVVVIGGGMVGRNAVAMAVGLGAEVTVLDRDLGVLDEIDIQYGSTVRCVYSTQANLEEEVLAADLVIGAVLVAGAAAPKLVTADMIRRMRPGSVVVDVAIDQGGCFETSRATTHTDPTYVVDDVVHYCVANMPGGVPRTSTIALNNATLPFTMALANKGAVPAMLADAHLLNGLNVFGGQVTEVSVAAALGYQHVNALTAIGG
jgi:alanine dehydrogenase